MKIDSKPSPVGRYLEGLKSCWPRRSLQSVDYPTAISHDEYQLEKLEKPHRYAHLFHHPKMLGLLKPKICPHLGEATEALDYSRQSQRRFKTYRQESSEELLVNRVHEHKRQELLTAEA